MATPHTNSEAKKKNVIVLYQNFRMFWDKHPRNLIACGKILPKLKMALTGITFLPIGGVNLSKQDLLLARDVLEHGAMYSAVQQEIPEFERYMAQLKYYYMDYTKYNLPESTLKYTLLALNLWLLLSQNRLAEFHIELELLPVSDWENDHILQQVIFMERCLMMGKHHKVLGMTCCSPVINPSGFVGLVHKNTRNEIAGCIEKAYRKLSLSASMKMFNFKKDSKKMTLKFAEERGWTLGEDNCFHFLAQDKGSSPEVFPAMQIANWMIRYAKEMNMIV